MAEDANRSEIVAGKPAGSRRKFLYVGVILLVILVAAVLISMQSDAANTNLVSYDGVAVPSALVAQLNIPNNLSNSVGIGTAQYEQVLYKLQNKTETVSGGKPEILYMGAEFCPYCAAERWAMIIALSRFGKFSNLHFMTSSATDSPPSVPTFTFYNSTYTSPYITFAEVEETTNKYATLQQPNASEAALGNDYDPNGTIPFILFANKSVVIGATYDPQGIITGENWSTIIKQLYNSSSVQAESIIGSANLLTEQICSADNNTPASVCTQGYVTQIRKTVGS
jgi:thiol-disulfide isomerase/thioredoxin